MKKPLFLKLSAKDHAKTVKLVNIKHIAFIEELPVGSLISTTGMRIEVLQSPQEILDKIDELTNVKLENT